MDVGVADEVAARRGERPGGDEQGVAGEEETDQKPGFGEDDADHADHADAGDEVADAHGDERVAGGLA